MFISLLCHCPVQEGQGRTRSMCRSGTRIPSTQVPEDLSIQQVGEGREQGLHFPGQSPVIEPHLASRESGRGVELHAQKEEKNMNVGEH